MPNRVCLLIQTVSREEHAYEERSGSYPPPQKGSKSEVGAAARISATPVSINRLNGICEALPQVESATFELLLFADDAHLSRRYGSSFPQSF